MPQEPSEIPADLEKIKTALRNAGVLRDDEETRSKLSVELSRQGASATEHKVSLFFNYDTPMISAADDLAVVKIAI